MIRARRALLSTALGTAALALAIAACGSERSVSGGGGDAGSDTASDAPLASDDASTDDASGEPFDALSDALPGGDCVPACGPNEYCFLSFPHADAGDPLDARDPYFKGCLPAPAECAGTPDCTCVKKATYAYCPSAEECIEHAGAVAVTCLR